MVATSNRDAANIDIHAAEASTCRLVGLEVDLDVGMQCTVAATTGSKVMIMQTVVVVGTLEVVEVVTPVATSVVKSQLKGTAMSEVMATAIRMAPALLREVLLSLFRFEYRSIRVMSVEVRWNLSQDPLYP